MSCLWGNCRSHCKRSYEKLIKITKKLERAYIKNKTTQLIELKKSPDLQWLRQFPRVKKEWNESIPFLFISIFRQLVLMPEQVGQDKKLDADRIVCLPYGQSHHLLSYLLLVGQHLAYSRTSANKFYRADDISVKFQFYHTGTDSFCSVFHKIILL